MKAIEKLIGKRVVIRSDRAGVFYGTLNEIEPCGDKYTVELTKNAYGGEVIRRLNNV